MTREVIVMGLRSKGPISDVKGLLTKVAEVSKAFGIEVQLVDATKVYGKEHLEVAAVRAIRAFDQGRNLGKTLAVEVLLYASCKRQVSEAIRTMGLREGMTVAGAVLIFAPGQNVGEKIPEALGLVRDDSVLEGSEEALDALGIGQEVRKGVPRMGWADLVLEKISLLDLER